MRLHEVCTFIVSSAFLWIYQAHALMTPAAIAQQPRQQQDSGLVRTETRCHGSLPRLSAWNEEDRPPSDNNMVKERITDRPTQTHVDVAGPSAVPSKPKIVVLGASGKIGRRVVRQLLEMPFLDATIIAFVRDYDKACRVLYDDILVARRSNKRRGPKLQIVEGDLVPQDELPGYVDDEREEWLKRATSAASFYRKDVETYDNTKYTETVPSNEALQDAIRGCTTIISCVGSRRPTNLWTDVLRTPVLRILRKDVSKWCKDARHPFYVHYASTQKALRYAESEQRKREAVASVENEGEAASEQKVVPRIRFIRISDLYVSQQPWCLVPLVTNMMQSLVYRYQNMAEQTLLASSLIETITIRPGDLIDDERDTQTTALQVDPDGTVPFPSIVGREDVAALAVSAALYSDIKRSSSSDAAASAKKEQHIIDDLPFHYTLGVRWVGDQLQPYPPQGDMRDGLSDANLCLRAALKKGQKTAKRQRRMRRKKEASYPEAVLRIAESVHANRKRIKPYGIFVAVPVYAMLIAMARSLWHVAALYMPGQKSILLPATRWLGDLLAMVGTYVLGSCTVIKGRIILPLLQFISRRGGPKYISF